MGARNRFRIVAQFGRCSIGGLWLFLWGCGGSISGQLMDEMKEPISSEQATVNVVRLDESDQPVRVVVSVSPTGRFEVEEDLPAGLYLVEVMVPGYSVKSEKVKLESKLDLEIVMLRLADVDRRSVIHSHLMIPSGRGEGNASLTPPRL